jgi:hypothetical protein
MAKNSEVVDVVGHNTRLGAKAGFAQVLPMLSVTPLNDTTFGISATVLGKVAERLNWMTPAVFLTDPVKFVTVTEMPMSKVNGPGTETLIDQLLESV